MELVLCAQAFGKGLLPPNLHMTEKAPDCDVDIITEPTPSKTDRILSNSFGFGGINACLVLGRA